MMGMSRNNCLNRWGDPSAPIAAVLPLLLLVPGCSGSSLGVPTTPAPTASTVAATVPPPPPPPSPPSPPSFKDKIASFFSSKSATAPEPAANATQPDVDCPYIDIRQGASTLTIPPPPPDGGNEAMALRYQGDFVRAARECKVVAGQIVMKVGVQGRIIVGPAGGPGQVDVPVRFAVVTSPTTGSKTIATKLARIPVTVTGTDANTTFTYIEDNLAFPLPSASELASYIVYIGFDPIGAAAEDQQRSRSAPKPPPKPRKPNPSAPTG